VLSEFPRFEPARPAFEFGAATAQWADVVTAAPPKNGPVAPHPDVEVIVGRREDRAGQLGAAVRDSHPPWVLFLDADDVPDEDLLPTLVGAQSGSGADVVTCGIRVDATEIFFLGEPGALGLLANHYGAVALIRRGLLEALGTSWSQGVDPDWRLLARLSLQGAAIVSVPRVLVERRTRPGAIETHTSDALAVTQEFEQQLPERLRSLARLVGGFAARPGARERTGVVGRARSWLAKTVRGR
jgi:hypothetical protein